MILAIDPGRDKTGVAVLDYDGSIHEKEIIKSSELYSYFKLLYNNYNIDNLVLGNGTGRENVFELLSEFKHKLSITEIDESYTTVEAEERYFKEEELSILIKFLRKFLKWKPERAVDDYVAVILAERFLEKKFPDNNN